MRIFSLFFFVFTLCTAQNQQVLINEPGSGNGVLEITTGAVGSNGGVLLPRVALTNVASLSPLPLTTEQGTLIYNTSNLIGKGFYFWTGSYWSTIAPNYSYWSNVGNFLSGVYGSTSSYYEDNAFVGDIRSNINGDWSSSTGYFGQPSNATLVDVSSDMSIGEKVKTIRISTDGNQTGSRIKLSSNLSDFFNRDNLLKIKKDQNSKILEFKLGVGDLTSIDKILDLNGDKVTNPTDLKIMDDSTGDGILDRELAKIVNYPGNPSPPTGSVSLANNQLEVSNQISSYGYSPVREVYVTVKTDPVNFAVFDTTASQNEFVDLNTIVSSVPSSSTDEIVLSKPLLKDINGDLLFKTFLGNSYADPIWRFNSDNSVPKRLVGTNENDSSPYFMATNGVPALMFYNYRVAALKGNFERNLFISSSSTFQSKEIPVYSFFDAPGTGLRCNVSWSNPSNGKGRSVLSGAGIGNSSTNFDSSNLDLFVDYENILSLEGSGTPGAENQNIITSSSLSVYDNSSSGDMLFKLNNDSKSLYFKPIIVPSWTDDSSKTVSAHLHDYITGKDGEIRCIAKTTSGGNVTKAVLVYWGSGGGTWTRLY